MTAKTALLVYGAASIGFAIGWVLRRKICENIPPEIPENEGPWKYAEEVSFHKFKIKGKIMTTTAQVKQEFVVTFPAPVDKYGNPASVENVTAYSEDESKATAELAPEVGPYSVKVKTQTTTGVTAVGLKADGDVGEGVKEIVAVHGVEVVGGDAVGFGEGTATVPVDSTDEPVEEEGGEEDTTPDEVIP
jgi:hypothetical protein